MKADFSKIISESIKITKSNKKLWVFGIVLASLGAGSNMGSSGNFGDAFKNTERQNQNNSVEYKLPTETSDPKLLNSNLIVSNLPQVLGTALAV
jgi:hypothetical protein